MRIRKATIWAATAAILAAFGPSYAQEAGDAHDHDHSGGAQSQTSEMPEKCQAMMAAAKQRRAERKDAAARLDELTARMDAAEGPALVDAIAATVTELARQRKEMAAGAMATHHEMMRHMMDHMQAGGADATGCPMMGQMAEHAK